MYISILSEPCSRTVEKKRISGAFLKKGDGIARALS